MISYKIHPSGIFAYDVIHKICICVYMQYAPRPTLRQPDEVARAHVGYT